MVEGVVVPSSTRITMPTSSLSLSKRSVPPEWVPPFGQAFEPEVCRGKVQVLKTPELVVEDRFTLASVRAARRLGKSSRHELSQLPTRLGFLRHHGRVRLLGYTRVSTAGQDAQLQLDALVGAGVQTRDVFADVTSGTRAGVERPGMQKLLAYAEAGDTLVVWRVDRIGWSMC